MRSPPLLKNKFHKRASVFTPENLLREARRQKRLAKGKVPEICVLDPDGDLVRHLRKIGAAELSAAWACYHTELYEFRAGGERLGVLGCAVGAPFAVLQMPEPPRFAPVDALLPPVEPSVSQYRVPARAGPPNSDTANMARVSTAAVRSAFLHGPPVRFAMGCLKTPLRPGIGHNRRELRRNCCLRPADSVTLRL